MDYRKKRKAVKLSAYTVAKELGVDFDKYKLVEKGEVPLEGDLLNKFLEITQPEKAKEIIFNRKQTIKEIKDFIKNDNIPRLMKARGYKTQKDLAGALGISTTPINQILNVKDKACVSDDMFEMVYDFLKNPLNNYIEGVTKKYKEQENTALTEEENKYYTELMDANFINRKKVAHDLGYSVSSVNNLFGKTYYGGQHLKDAFIDYMKQYEPVETLEEKLNNSVEPPIKIDELKFEDGVKYYIENDIDNKVKDYIENDIDNKVKDYIENDINVTNKAIDYSEQLKFYEACNRGTTIHELLEKLHEAEKKIERYEKIIDSLLKEGE